MLLSVSDVANVEPHTKLLFRVDFQELYSRLVLPLPAGVTLIAIFDTCRSGTMLDLPHCREYPVNRYPPSSNQASESKSAKTEANVVSLSPHEAHIKTR